MHGVLLKQCAKLVSRHELNVLQLRLRMTRVSVVVCYRQCVLHCEL